MVNKLKWIADNWMLVLLWVFVMLVIVYIIIPLFADWFGTTTIGSDFAIWCAQPITTMNNGLFIWILFIFFAVFRNNSK